MFSIRSKRILTASLVLSLAGCVSPPPQQTYNKEANQGIKTIQVLQLPPTEPGVFIKNNPGGSFGLVGAVVSQSDLAVKRKKLRDALEASHIDYVAAFKTALTEAMERRGYTLIWPEPTVETTRSKRQANGARKAFGSIDNADAQLDVSFQFFGYAASGSGAGSPYRPTGWLLAQLVSADGQTTLFSETLAYHNVFDLKGAIVISPDEKYSYPNFSDIDDAQSQAAEGMRVLAETLAATLAEQL